MHIEGDADSEDEKMEGFVVQAVKSMEDYDCGQGTQTHILVQSSWYKGSSSLSDFYYY